MSRSSRLRRKWAGALVEIRCRGCGRLLGLGPRDFRIYCDELCATDYPAQESTWSRQPGTNANSEARDALIECIFQVRSPAKSALAEYFGISRQRVDQIIANRTIKKA